MSEQENNEFPPGEPGGEGEFREELSSGRPAVAAAQGKFFIVVGLAVFAIIVVVKLLFFSPKEAHPPVKPPHETISQASHAIGNNMELAPPPLMPATPPQEASAPPPPPPPPSPQQLAPPPPPSITAQGPTNEQLKARIHSPMLAVNSSKNGTNTTENKKLQSVAGDANSAWAQGIEDSKVETVQATEVKNLDHTLIQGKLVEGVLETAIDSTLPGPIRAIVSHDVYAESGRSILIPKGSRIIGTYNASIRRGQGRVMIIWTRVVRPDGVDIAINSPGVDALGRAGMTGFVDNKYFEAFSTAILTSSMDVAVAAVGDALFGNQQQTQTDVNGGVTTVQSPTATAMQAAVQNIGSVGQAIVGSAINLQPTIYVDQGEQISIFVNKDIVFPSGSGEASFIP